MRRFFWDTNLESFDPTVYPAYSIACILDHLTHNQFVAPRRELLRLAAIYPQGGGCQLWKSIDRAEENLNPVGRVFYCASTMICTPASRAQEVGLALGAQAGEARLRDIVTSAGFSHFRRAAQTPFNLVFEARP